MQVLHWESASSGCNCFDVDSFLLSRRGCSMWSGFNGVLLHLQQLLQHSYSVLVWVQQHADRKSTVLVHFHPKTTGTRKHIPLFPEGDFPSHPATVRRGCDSAVIKHLRRSVCRKKKSRRALLGSAGLNRTAETHLMSILCPHLIKIDKTRRDAAENTHTQHFAAKPESIFICQMYLTTKGTME